MCQSELHPSELQAERLTMLITIIHISEINGFRKKTKFHQQANTWKVTIMQIFHLFLIEIERGLTEIERGGGGGGGGGQGR